jgi:hypothetical protein
MGSEAERNRLRRWLDSIAAAPSVRQSTHEGGASREEDHVVVRSKKVRKSERLKRRKGARVTAPVVQRRFYLELTSPVVDAPTIGTRMAERLGVVNVSTVGDLIAADAAAIAAALKDKHVTTETVTEWQQQAMLVCRIPNLRGLDSQLLVAAGYTTAELVANSDADSLYEAVAQVANSRAGQRYLRGGNPPDADKVSQWITWAQKCRGVRAA